MNTDYSFVISSQSTIHYVIRLIKLECTLNTFSIPINFETLLEILTQKNMTDKG